MPGIHLREAAEAAVRAQSALSPGSSMPHLALWTVHARLVLRHSVMAHPEAIVQPS